MSYVGMFAYPWDILDEGMDQALGRLADDIGIDAIHLATTYHSVKMLLPHNPRRKMFYADSSAAYFQPQTQLYSSTPIKPVVSPMVAETNLLAQIAAGCERHGLGLVSWTLALHDDRLATLHPSCAQRNVFGDPFPCNLCPSSPEARAYLVALSKDLSSNYNLAGLELESAYFGGLGHGYSHEKAPSLNLGRQGHFLLSLCFCENCIGRAKEAGIPVSQLQAAVRARLEAILLKVDPIGSNPDRMEDLLEEVKGLAEFVAMREDVVTSLIQEVKEAIPARLHFILMGDRWTNGTDNAAIAGACDLFEITCYTSSPEVLRERVREVVTDLRDARQLLVILSVSHAHSPSYEALERLVGEVADLGVENLAFYNYGLMTQEGLSWVKRAVQAFRA